MPNVSEQAWRDFSANAACLEADSAGIHTRYLDKWIGIYKGEVVAVGNAFDDVTRELESKHIPTTETLIRFIGQKEMTLIL